ncbi:unnamed protein product [Camellia sinensis]
MRGGEREKREEGGGRRLPPAVAARRLAAGRRSRPIVAIAARRSSYTAVASASGPASASSSSSPTGYGPLQSGHSLLPPPPPSSLPLPLLPSSLPLRFFFFENLPPKRRRFGGCWKRPPGRAAENPNSVNNANCVVSERFLKRLCLHYTTEGKMAAEALLVATAKEILKKLISITSEMSLAWGLKAELKRLTRRFKTAQALLCDAEDRKTIEKEAVLDWLKNLKAVASDAEDVLDELAFEVLRRKLEVKNRITNKVRNFFTLSNPLALRLKMFHKVNNINTMLDQIYKEANEIGLKAVEVINTSVVELREIRPTDPFVDDSKVVGRDGDLSILVEMLLLSSDNDEEEEEALPVISIMGMARLGKTTLVQIVYKDKRVVRNFGERMWVCVSDDFNVQRLLNEMVQSLTGTTSEMSNREAIVKKLRESLEGKKYLLVLDDVWNEIPEKWENMRNSLLGIGGSKGSKIIVTTRNEVVASTMQASRTHRLVGLSNDDSWTIFRQKAFARGGPQETPNLVVVGQRIVKRCGGVPLAVKTLGGLMHSKKNEHDWLSIERSEIWNSSQKINGTDSFPSLRYGILLGDVSMDKTRLRVLNLVKSEMKELPSSISKMIHLRYLDISRTAIKELPSFVTNLYNLQTLRILYCLFLEKLPREFRKLVKLRHFYMDDDEKRRNLMPVGLGQLTCLLTLPFFVVGQNKGCGIEELGCLHNLRGVVKIYVLEHVKSKEGAQKANLSSNPNIQELRFHWTNDEVENTDINNAVDVLEGLKPHSNLKGLVIENYRGEKLASWMMVKDHTSLLYNLVKIELKYYKRLGEIPALGHLPFLQVLQIVGMHNVKSVGTEFYGPHNLNDGGRETSIFQALRELSLQYMPSLIEWSEAAVAAYPGSSGLVFPSLEVLNIGWCPRLIMAPSHFPSIKTLTIAEINSVALRKMSNKLTSLTFLNLSKVSGSEINFVLEEMFKNNRSLLKHVTIDSCDGVAHVPNVLHDLASLETLCIKECPNITTILDINEEHNGLTRLQDIMIAKCNKLTCLPKGIGNLASLERLAVSECPNLTVIDPSDICRLISLRSLEIKKCGILRTYNCWPEWLLSLTPDLTRLVIGDFSEELDYFPWPTITSTTTTSTCTNSSCSSSNFNITHQVQQRFFVSLKSLTLYGWSKLTSLPDQLQHLTALIDLSIWEFDGLESLPDWLGNLSSLQALHLWKCKNLMILPSMEAMRSLTKLRSLKIRWCPLLKEKCSKESGPDWHKISHIPSIQIDSNYVKLGSNHTNENDYKPIGNTAEIEECK